MKKQTVNKSEAVREYARANPAAKPREIAEALTAEGVPVSSHVVSQVLYNAKKKGVMKKRGKKARRAKATAKAPRAAAKTRSSGDGMEQLLEAKRLADMVGGVDKAKKLLDNLAKLRD